MSLISDNSIEFICPGVDLGHDDASFSPHSREFFQS